MLSDLEGVLKENWKMLTYFLVATFFDSTSTILAMTKPGSVELNPISAGFINTETVLRTTGLLSAPALLLLVIILVTWAMVDRQKWDKYFRTAVEAAATLQLLAGINNTLIYFGKGTPITLLALAFALGHYTTRLHIIWKRRKDYTSIRDSLPNPLN